MEIFAFTELENLSLLLSFNRNKQSPIFKATGVHTKPSAFLDRSNDKR